MNIELKLETFEGPLDLLLHLIERSEIDLYEISIAEVTQQYMEVLAEMQRLELDVASEFLVMASTLLAMKSKMLLPKPEPDTFQPGFDMDVEEVDPRQELILRLVEYKRFKLLAEMLKKRGKDRAKVFTRIPADLQAFIPEKEPNPVKDVSVYDLAKAFQSILANKKKAEPTSRIKRDTLSVSERVHALRTLLHRKKEIKFTKLLTGLPTREAVIVTFLAVLELIKKREVVCEQKQLFSEIVICRNEVNEASG